MRVVVRRIRRDRRWVVSLLLGFCGAVVLALSACTIPPVYLYLNVTTTADGRDAVAGDGVCEMTRGTGDCSLRAAIDEANATVGKVPWIKVPGGWYMLSRSGADDSNQVGDLDLAPAGGTLTIEAVQPAVVVANREDRALDVRAGTVTIRGLGLADGSLANITVRSSATLQLSRSSVTTSSGIGIEVDAGATALVDNTTIGANVASGVRNDGRFEAVFTTIYTDRGTAVAGSAAVVLEASIVGNNGYGESCSVDVVSRGYNLGTDNTCDLDHATDVLDRPPATSLSGTDLRYFVFDTNSVVDAMPPGLGPCPDRSAPTADQRGSHRPVGNGCDRGAIDTNQLFRVTSSVDAVDRQPGDGACDVGGGVCTLRAAITEANRTPGLDTVEIVGGVNPSLSIAGRDENSNSSGDLDITERLILNGGGSTVDARGLDRVFDAHFDAEFQNVTIRGGDAGAADGGGIRGTYLTLKRVRLTANRATNGGGAYATWDVSMDASTVDGNTATNQAGGLRTGRYSSVRNSTLVGNSSPSGAAIYAPGPGLINSRLEFSTVAGNRGSAAIAGGGWWLQASIVASHGVNNCDGTGFRSSGWNLTTDATCGLADPTDRAWQHPLLHPLAGNGGPLPTALLGSDSPARDAIPVGTSGLCDGSLTDQRGVARPQGSRCDIGAVEGSGAAVTPPSIRVDSAADTRDPNPGDGTCGSGPGSCTLRAAIDEANATDLPRRLVVAPGIQPRLSRVGANEDANATGDVDVVGFVTIDGDGAMIDGARLDRVIHKLGSGNGVLRLEEITLTNGEIATAGAVGGGVKSDGGLLELVDAVVDGNRLTGTGATKGAGAFLGAGTATIVRTVISGNTGAATGGGMFVAAGTNASLADSQVEQNSAAVGGAIATEANLTIARSTIAGNTAPSSGAVTSLLPQATLTISDSVVRANAARGIWAAKAQISGTLIEANLEGGLRLAGTVKRSTIRGNTAQSGGGVWIDGSTTIEGTTINDNVASSLGGGLFVPSGAVSLTVKGSTIADNRAPYGSALRGGATFQYSTIASRSPGSLVYDGALRSSASIFGSTSGSICELVTATSLGYNLLTDSSCGLASTSDLVAVGPVLHGLADNGGPTATVMPAAGSPAIDAIPLGTTGLCDGSVPTDQRGFTRPVGSGCDIGAVEGTGAPIPALHLVVGEATDGVDVAPGDGVCRTSAGTCTLRAAITEANAWPAADQITIAAGIHPNLSLPGAAEDGNASGDLDVWDTVVIRGTRSVVNANQIDRVIHHLAGTLTLEGVEITGGRGTEANGVGFGAGIRSGGDLVIRSSTIRDNSLESSGAANGAGVYVERARPLTIEGSAIVGNRASGRGATAAGLSAPEAIARITQSTISDNTISDGIEPTGVSDLWVSGTVTFTTLRGRSALPVVKGGSRLTIGASVISNSIGPACEDRPVSLGWNVASDTTCALTANGDVQNVEPYLFPLAENGGPTPTRLPASNSRAINRIPAGTAGFCDGAVPTDQRGLPRPAGGACDAGAVEGSGPAAVALSLTVNSALDEPDAAPNDMVCRTASGVCSLRAAITEANQFPNQTDTITIASGINPVLSIAGRNEDANLTGDLDIEGSVTIRGNGARIDAAGLDTVIDHTYGWVTLRDLTLTGGLSYGGGAVESSKPLTMIGVTVTGNAGSTTGGVLTSGSISITNSLFANNHGSGGGGLYALFSSVTIRDTTFQGNHASSTIDGGGAIALYSATATIERVTISGNTTAGNGGGLHVSGGTVNLLSSTLSGNSAHYGGGMYAAGTVNVTNSTVSGNVATYGSAIGRPTGGAAGTVTVTTSTLVGHSGSTTLIGAMRLRGTIVDAAGAPAACAAAVTSLGWNLSSDTSCGLTQSGDRQSISAQLGALAANGGSTLTHLPAPSSPAVNAIPLGTAGLCDATNTADQRGVARPQGSGCDIGAVEQ